MNRVCATFYLHHTMIIGESIPERQPVNLRLMNPGSRTHCSLHSTRRTAASTPQTLLVASICGPPAAISCSYRDTGVRCSVVGPFLCPARRPATRYQTTCEISRARSFNSFRQDLKTFLFSFYQLTQRIRCFAVMRYINLLLTLTLTLTYRDAT